MDTDILKKIEESLFWIRVIAVLGLVALCYIAYRLA